MARRSRGPWYLKARKQWVVNVRGKRYYLGPEKTKAYKEWHKLQAEEKRPITSDHVVVVFDAFLEWTQKNREASTYEWYLQRLNEFASRVPHQRVEDIRPVDVQQWIDTKNSDAHKLGCVTAVNRAFNWAVKMGIIEKNPIKGMERPSAGKRDVVITDDQYKTMLSLSSDQSFRDLLTFCWETGARPQEAVNVEGRHLDEEHQRIVFPEKESKGKKKKRVIYCNDAAWGILTNALKRYPDGKLLRNARREPWKRNNIACRFARMKEKLGFKAKLYHLRHTWMTRMLKKGNDPITVATLAGHNDPSMLARVYQHVGQDTDHLHAALARLG